MRNNKDEGEQHGTSKKSDNESNDSVCGVAAFFIEPFFQLITERVLSVVVVMGALHR